MAFRYSAGLLFPTSRRSNLQTCTLFWITACKARRSGAKHTKRNLKHLHRSLILPSRQLMLFREITQSSYQAHNLLSHGLIRHESAQKKLGGALVKSAVSQDTESPTSHHRAFPAGQGGSAWLIHSQMGESMIQWISLLNTVALGNSKRGKKELRNKAFKFWTLNKGGAI